MGGAAYGVQCWRLVVIDDTGFPKKGIHSVGVTRLWLPVPSINTDYQRSLENSFSSNGTTQLTQDGQHGAKMLYVEFAANEAKPFVLLTSRVQTQNRAVDWSQKTAAAEDADTLRYFTQPSAFIPTDGIVRKTALAVTQGTRTDVEKAQKIYDWIVANIYREPKVRGCGEGDIKTMLETANLGGDGLQHGERRVAAQVKRQESAFLHVPRRQKLSRAL